MNGPISRLFGCCCLLFALVVLATTRWTAIEDGRLRAHPGNQRDELRAQSKPRGPIRAGDGSLLAGTRRVAGGLRRRYPFGAAFAHPVGYASGRLGETGLERAYRDQLRAGADFDGVLGLLGVRDREAQDLVTSLRPAAQRAALEGLRGRAGAVVALEPATGRVLAWASTPSFEPVGAFELESEDIGGTGGHGRARRGGRRPRRAGSRRGRHPCGPGRRVPSRVPSLSIGCTI